MSMFKGLDERTKANIIVIILFISLISFCFMGAYFDTQQIEQCKVDCEDLGYTILEHKDYLFREQCYCKNCNISIRIW